MNRLTESSNPAAYGLANTERTMDKNSAMTVKGATNKTIILLVVAFLAAALSVSMIEEDPGVTNVLLYGGMIGGLVVALITIFKQNLAPFTAPVYAILEGLFLGAVTFMFEAMYPGIGLQALVVTFGLFFGMLMVYGYRIIRVTDKFRKTMFGLILGVMIIYLISFIGQFAGFQVPYIHESGTVGILFSLFVVGLASFSLLLDFDLIERAVYDRAPAYMEWYGAFTLLVTLVWLYIEVLKLIAKLRSGNQ